MQRKEWLFAERDSRRFRTPQTRKSRCSNLVENGEIVHDPEKLLGIWCNHSKSLLSLILGNLLAQLTGMTRQLCLEMESHMNEEFLLDVPFGSWEVTWAVAKLKKWKPLGPDGLIAEHLKAGGDKVVI